MDRSHSNPARWGLLAGALLLVACRELPKQPGVSVVVLEQGRLAEVNPADVAVVPLELAAGVQMPADRLRTAIAVALPSRNYSPLSIDFVDSRVVEASYDYGVLGEDAVCQVTVHGWDERYWETGQFLEVDVELRMIDPAAPDGPALWAGRLTRRIDVGEYRNEVIEGKLYDKALEMVAKELLAALPARETRAGRG